MLFYIKYVGVLLNTKNADIWKIISKMLEQTLGKFLVKGLANIGEILSIFKKKYREILTILVFGK